MYHKKTKKFLLIFRLSFFRLVCSWKFLSVYCLWLYRLAYQ